MLLALGLLASSGLAARLHPAGAQPTAAGRSAPAPVPADAGAAWPDRLDHLTRIAQGPERGTLPHAQAIDDLIAAAAMSPDPDRIAQALALAPQGVGIKERLLGPFDPGLAHSLALEAHLHWLAGSPRDGRQAGERALAIRRRALGPAHPLTAASCYQVAEICRMSGNYARAIALHEEAVSIWRHDRGDDPYGIANSLEYLGVLHWTLGDTGAARSFIQRAVAERQRLAGPADPAIAPGLNRLGSLSLIHGRLDEAMRLFAQARSIWESAYGPDDPRVALSLERQAEALGQAGEHRGARARLERVLAIRLAAFGPTHPLVARAHAGMADVDLRLGRLPEAGASFRRALEILAGRTGPGGLEAAGIQARYARYLLAASDPEGALEAALRAERLARETFRSTASGLTETQALSYERVRARGLDVAFTALAAAPGDARHGRPDAGRAWEELVRSRAMVLDFMATRHRAGEEPAADFGLRDAAARLPEGAALVGYVRYGRLGGAGEEAVPAYAALVLRAGAADPFLVRLSPASVIDAAVEAWRRHVGSDPRAAPREQAEARYRVVGERLRSLIWDPIAPLVGDRKLVLVVPDGAIGLVSLGSLPGGSGRYMLEDARRLHYLSAERSLGLPAAARRPDAVLALGGADFDARADEGARGAGALEAPGCGVLAARRFEPLPGTLQEIRDVEGLWSARADVTVLAGQAASEAAFRRLSPGRTVLHVATHGFFLQEECRSLLGDEPPDELLPRGDPPLRLAGLALAGANHHAAAGPGEYDGLLTAEEIGGMDLSGVEWAVLSGCETAIGQVADGEGLLGLRRALESAGARTMITSLWPVEDGAARVWMRHLHDGRRAGLSTVEAVRRAALRMIEEQRARGGTTHPFFWGAFVAAGDWR